MENDNENPSGEAPKDEAMKEADDSDAKKEASSSPLLSSSSKVATKNDAREDTGMRRSSRTRKAPDRSYIEDAYFESLLKKKKKPKISAPPKKQQKKVTSKTHPPKTKKTKKSRDSPASPKSAGPPGGVWTDTHSPYISLEIRRPIPPPYYFHPHTHMMENVKLNTGVITHWCPPIDRTPALYHVSYANGTYTEDLVLKEVESALSSHKKRGGNSLSQAQLQVETDKISLHAKNRQRRADTTLKNACLTLLPHLCVTAVYELHRLVQKTKNVHSRADVPDYYRFPPSHGTREEREGVNFTALLQRVKLGCQLAHEYFLRKSRAGGGGGWGGDGGGVRVSTRRRDQAGSAEVIELPRDHEPGGKVAQALVRLLDRYDKGGDFFRDASIGDLTSEDYFCPSRDRLFHVIGRFNGLSNTDAFNSVISILEDDITIEVEDGGVPMGLECVSEHNLSMLKSCEVNRFYKTKFAIKKDVEEYSPEESIKREKEEQDRRQFETWRYKSVHEGHSVGFASWQEHSKSLLKALQPLEDEAIDAAATTSDDNEKPTPQSMVQSDEALARSLYSRRSKRVSTQSQSEPIFYGSVSHLTHAQLCDSIFRLICSASPAGMSLLDLQRVLEEDMNLRRIKTSIMRLLFKEGKIARLDVATMSFAEEEKKMNGMGQSPAPKLTEEQKEETAEKGVTDQLELRNYILELKKTESRLRYLLISQLQLPVERLSRAADDDALADAETPHPNKTWQHHDYVGESILRPDGKEWTIEAYCPPYTATETTEDGGVTKRGRFQIVNGDEEEEVTEGQVRAGREALSVLQKQPKIKRLERYVGERLSILPRNNTQGKTRDAVIAGYSEDTSTDSERMRFLLLVDKYDNKEEDSDSDSDSDSDDDDDDGSLENDESFPSPGSSFWTTYENDTITHDNETYPISFHSPYLSAFPMASTIISTLKSHPKAPPFMEPVDPVELQIPDYPRIIKNPMDISTLEKNLHSGKYATEDEFRSDLVLIFDNAIKFNGEGNWITASAKSLKRLCLQKLSSHQPIAEPDHYPRKKSVYDEDSDFSFDDDYDDDHHNHRSRRKRKGRQKNNGNTAGSSVSQSNFDANTPIEQSIKIPPLNTTAPIPLNLPLNTTPSTFSLPEDYFVRHHSTSSTTSETSASNQISPEDEEAIRLALQDNAYTRRSSRAAAKASAKASNGSKTTCATIANIQYYTPYHTASTRLEVESYRESQHEVHSRTFNQSSPMESDRVHYDSNTFPPYLGRVINNVWEIRSDYLLPAARWVIRGLISSGHVAEAPDGGVVLQNVYYWNKGIQPMDILEVKKTASKKESEESGSSEEEEKRDLSEYEKMRAERVARNQERLKALGLG